MRRPTLSLAGLVLAAAAAAAQYHDPTYLMGGYGTTTSYYWNGVWLVDAQKQKLKHLTPSERCYYSRSIIMDADNRRIVFVAEGTTSSSYTKKSGLYRLDPGTLAITTVLADSLALYSPRRLLINQDGDYVFTCYQRTRVTPTTLYRYAFLKLSAGSTLTTILSSTKMGGTYSAYSVGINMDTGNYLFNLYQSPRFYYAVLDVADDGSFTTFGGGPSPSYGWYGYYSNLEQNFKNGHLQGQYSGLLYQLRQGDRTRTTLWNLGYPGSFVMRYTSDFDLQSAAPQRLVATGSEFKYRGGLSYNEPAVFYIDPTPPYTVVAVNCDPQNTTGLRYHYTYGFDFYRGRHLQTIKMGNRVWDLRLSCPRYAGKQYVVALSLTGYRPGLPLPDGRQLYLRPDDLTRLSVQNQLKPFFDPGPLLLDASGEAVATLKLGAFPRANTPLWIAVAVLDPAAPSGIAYLPDTYVMRI